MGQCCCCCCETSEQRVKETFQESEIIEKEICGAKLEYQRSTGICQVKESGAFVLTSEVVWFCLLCEDKRITIPLRNIRAVWIMNSCGQGRLVFDFVDGVSGIEDQVVIAIRESGHWLRQINEAISKATTITF